MSETYHGLPVAGYLPQSRNKIEEVNTNKRLEEMLLRRLDALAKNPEIDGRWLALARTNLEIAFMCLNRSVFKPERVNLEDLS